MSEKAPVHNSSRAELLTRAFEPLKADHPLVTGDKTCPGCQKPFAAGDVTCLVTIGPGDDPEERKKAKEGRAYNAVALPAHYGCVIGEDPA